LEYLTKTNLKFVRSTTGTTYINRYVAITRGLGTRDSLPSPTQWISGIGFINSNALGSGTEYDAEFVESLQFFEWSGAELFVYVPELDGVRLIVHPLQRVPYAFR